MKSMCSVTSLEVRERPREKISQFGAGRLSDLELMAVLLGKGTRGVGVLKLAAQVLQELDRVGERVSVDGLCALNGMGLAKASTVVAAMELARRRIHPHGVKVNGPGDIAALVRHLEDRKQELFVSISLNGAHEVIATRVVTVGLVNKTQIHPREVFADAIADRATAIIVAHNHPSGEMQPSKEDEAVTKLLCEAGKLLGIPVLDHVIFGGRGGAYFSFSEAGKLSG